VTNPTRYTKIAAVRLRESLIRTRASLRLMMQEVSDPGTEALAAEWEAGDLITRTNNLADLEANQPTAGPDDLKDAERLVREKCCAATAWWRGHDHTTAVFCREANEILDGKEPGGTSREPWQSLRERLWKLAAPPAADHTERARETARKLINRTGHNQPKNYDAIRIAAEVIAEALVAAERAGAEKMRKRARVECTTIAAGYLNENRSDKERGSDMASVAGHCASAIRALPLPGEE
jgi:hypothetical protein